ncbi:MAG TPA: hypothetical protein VLO11_04785, partial [Luteolibacter sp.]|nr:hypothetical protein [Luteolibacter sp.]
MKIPSYPTRRASLGSLAALALCFTVSSQAEFVVQYDNPLIPVGLRPGDSFHLVFVTGGTIQRDLLDGVDDGSDNSTIADWDAHVNSVADASTLPGGMGDINWLAMVSTTTVAAKDHAVVTAPIYRVDGTLIATDSSDLWDGGIAAPIIINQNGGSLGTGQAVFFETWTGDASNYSSAGVIGTYSLGNGTEAAQVGYADQSGGGWHSFGSHTRRGPNDSKRVYALSERITIAVPDDADGDGLPDWFEAAHTEPSSTTALDPTSDLDQDGLTALQEYESVTPLNPASPDTDNDGLLDGVSIALTNSDPRYASWAADGIAYSEESGTRTFRGEATMGTDPVVADTDGDGLPDGVESNTNVWVSASDTGTDPLETDSDYDALSDGIETNTGVLVDRKTDSGTSPVLADTDGDGAGDWYEITATFTSPFDSAEQPNVPYPLPAYDGSPLAADKPVKVFILSGQSNMVGIGYVNGSKPESLDTITKVDGKFPNLIDGGKNYLPREDVWYEGVYNATAKKWLSAGCGADGTQLGPEIGFGQVMGWHLDEPVILIKASQGNRGLGWDILPPTSPRIDWTNGRTYAGYGDATQSWVTGTTPVPGGWYAGKEFDQFFMDDSEWAQPGDGSFVNVVDVLDNFEAKFPQWAAQGFEIAGYAWWQGHWDQLAGSPYADKYEENLVRLIQQVRGYYEARYPGKVVPSAPFAVATIGFDGEPYDPASGPGKVHAAQLAVADAVKYPAFTGNVKSVDTLPYWRTVDESPGVQGFHYHNNAETYMLVGDALGRAMVEMLETPDTFAPAPDPMTFAIAPTAVNPSTVGMVATTAVDPAGPVEYFFENVTTSENSGWMATPGWNDSGLAAGSYDFRVKARDALGNEGGWSATASASPGNDITKPSPDPMSFSAPPTATGETTITMTATTASDINGVEYYFNCTLGGGPASGWQASPPFTATGLTGGTGYTYVV